MRVLLILLLLCSTANAALTPNKLPKTKTGGSSPTLQDSVIYDDGTNVGIGSTSPNALLVVKDSGALPTIFSPDIVVSDTSGASDSGILSLISGVNGFSTINFGDTDDENIGYFQYSHPNNSMTFGANTNAYLLIDSGGNVGINTLAPNATLEVIEASAINAFRVNDQASDTTPFIIDATGNVGIGSHAPITKLNITPESGSGDGVFISRAGNGDTAGGYWRLALRSSANNDSMNLAQSSSNYTSGGTFAWVGNSEGFLYYPTTFKVGTGVAGSPAMYFNSNGNIGIGTLTNPTAKLTIESTAAQDLFRVSDDGASDPSPFIIDSTGNVGIGTTLTSTSALTVMNGNVGIGTWLPSKAFEVGARRFQVQADGDIILANGSISTNTSGVRLDFSPNSSSSAGQTFFRLSSGTTSLASAGQSTIVAINPVISQSGTAGYTGLSLNVTESSIGSGPRELINVQNGSTRMMVLTSDGNLGISTFQPNALLDVSSTVAQDLFRVNDNGTGDATPFIINSTGNVGIGTIAPVAELEVTQIAALDAFRVNDEATDTTPFIITSAGNVGIGTSIPAAVTNIVSTAASDLFRVDDNGGGDTTPFIITSDGNVGIGTITSTRILSIYASTPVMQITNPTSGGTANDGFLFTQGGLDTYLENSEAGSMFFRTSATNRIKIDSGGNVGIGTTVMTNKLHMPNNATAQGHAACWGANNCAGYCTDVVSVTGTCTCTCL